MYIPGANFKHTSNHCKINKITTPYFEHFIQENLKGPKRSSKEFIDVLSRENSNHEQTLNVLWMNQKQTVSKVHVCKLTFFERCCTYTGTVHIHNYVCICWLHSNLNFPSLRPLRHQLPLRTSWSYVSASGYLKQ